MTITAECLRSLLSYEATTGNFVWLRKRGRAEVGSIAGGIEPDGYRFIRINGRKYCAHRLAWLFVNGEWPDNEIDHINGLRSDNRIANLRQATRSQNGANTKLPTTNSVGLKGVCFHKRNRRFQATIGLNGAKKHIGYFATANEAHAAYKAAAEMIYGDYARFK